VAKRWKQAGLILPALVAVVFADAAAVLLFTKSGFPPLALAVGYAIIVIAIYLAAVRWTSGAASPCVPSTDAEYMQAVP
jgi:hypothetical protein